MLKPVKTNLSPNLRAGGAAFAIVASQYNARYVDAMLRAAKAELKRAGARAVHVFRVPGAYEIPIVAARLARRGISSHASRITQPPLPPSFVWASSSAARPSTRLTLARPSAGR